MFVYYKCYIKIELMFLKELMLIKQVNQKSVIFFCNRCHDFIVGTPPPPSPLLRGGGGGRTFQKLSYLGGTPGTFLLESGDKPEKEGLM